MIKRSAKALALMAMLAAGWVAAPALSQEPYLPEAVDFEQRLGQVSRVAEPVAAKGRALAAEAEERRHAHDEREFRSAVLEAPERFDLAGIAGEIRPLELRARESEGEWSEWVETANGDPVYFGGAEELQVRAHGWRPAGRVHYVNVSGTTSGPESALTGARQAINSAFVSVSGLFGATAEALPTRPPIIKRSAWGATRPTGGCKPRARPSYGRVKTAVVHHTVTSGRYSEEEAPAIVLGICRYHRNANGWNDIGYDALVDRYGNIYAGRSGGIRKAVVGAHAQGFNAQSTGVAAIGTHTSVPISAETEESLIQFLAWKLAVHGLTARGSTTLTSAGGDASRYPSGRRVRAKKIVGHRTLGLTACPGETLELEVPRIRRLVQERIDAGGGPAPVPPPTAPPPDEDVGGVVPR